MVIMRGEDEANNATGESNDQRANRVEDMVNGLLRNFMDIFASHEFLRMRTQYSNFNPSEFMANFNQSFGESD